MASCDRQQPARRASTALVEVLTEDGEAFPVKRKLLRPCINLTQVVRGGVPCVSVAVNTLVFDRCGPGLTPAATPRVLAAAASCDVLVVLQHVCVLDTALLVLCFSMPLLV
jgi:hypothetical protein